MQLRVRVPSHERELRGRHVDAEADALVSRVGPLAGIKVVEVAELLPGPFFTHCMSELGAEVVKVERPGAGDPMSVMRPASYEYINRDKAVVSHDVRTPDGLDSVRDLVRGADVFVEGSRPGVMERRHLGYTSLSESNPRLVYVSISGFGQTGPLAQVPGHDINYQAVAGALAVSGVPDQGPRMGSLLAYSDFAGAAYALSATLAALYERTSSGRGQYLDVSLADAIGHWMVPLGVHLRSQGLHELGDVRGLMKDRSGYATFRCSDDQWIALGALEDRFLERSLVALGVDTAEAAAPPERVNGLLAAALGLMTSHDALQVLIANDVPATRVSTPAEYCEAAHLGERPVRDDGLPGFPVVFGRGGA